MDGLLLIDKPKGWTSFDVVAKVRGLLRSQQSLVVSLQSEAQATSDKRQATPSRKVKVGHTGTLDPMATGLLVLAIGKYTKKVPELTKQDKTYLAQVTLGKISNTDDAEGVITDSRSWSLDLREVSEFSKIQDPRSKIAQPTKKQVQDCLQGFVGEIQQVPPQFSAIKIAGLRSYKVARSGNVVKHQPRTVTIYSITDIKYDYPTVTFTANVGSGTYIRSLARDLGQKLGVGAYLSSLRRTSIGDFKIKDATAIDGITGELIAKNTIALE